MTNKLLSSVAFLTTIFALQNAQSAEIPQALTIDRLSAETADFLADSKNVDITSVHDLNTEKTAETDVSVKIDGKTYYIAPKDAENYALLQTLADIGSAALVKLDNAEGAVYRLEIDGETVYYGYNAQKLPKSGYSLIKISAAEAAASNDRVVKKYTKNPDHTLSETYYKVKINEAKFNNFASHDTIKWKEISESEKDTEIENSGVISFTIPGEGIKYYRYSYNPDDYDNDENNRKLYTLKPSSSTFPQNSSIDADFIGNFYTSETNVAYGGALSNSGTRGDITGDFINNYVKTPYINSGIIVADGGAINNFGHLGNIIGNFLGNYAEAAGVTYGGAIFTYTSIGNIIGNFVGNYAKSTQSSAEGGAIWARTATIGNITGDFINNYAQGTSAYGGAIYNYGTIGNITGDFINNYAQGTSSSAYGGAISNSSNSTIGNITGDFINNYAQGTSSSAYGGAIYNYSNSTIGNITGDFINNYAQGTSAYGGAIYNYGTIGNITGDFINNYAQGTSSSAYGGAISNSSNSTIGNITGDFINNYAQGTSSSAYGGAISNYGTIGNITGDFINNYAQGTSSSAYGGAISNYYNSTIGNITGDFINNYAQGTYAYGGAIYNANSIGLWGEEYVSIDGDTDSATGPYWYRDAGEIDSSFTLSGNTFTGNYVKSEESDAKGGAIANVVELTSYLNLYNENSEDWTNDDGDPMTPEEILNQIKENHSEEEYASTWQEVLENVKISQVLNLINTTFVNNRAEAAGSALGGAVYSNADVNITADNATSLFAGNTANGKSNAIYMDSLKIENTVSDPDGEETTETVEYADKPAVLTLSAVNKGKLIMNDAIDGVKYNLNISGDGTGEVALNNSVTGVKELSFGKNAVLHLGTKADIHTQNMKIEKNATVTRNAVANPTLKIDVDVDRANDKINSGMINVAEDVSGSYSLIINALTPSTLANSENASFAFLSAPNDTDSSDEAFEVSRIIGSPYKWGTMLNAKGEENGSTWYLSAPDTSLTVPEVIAGAGLHEAAIEQTRSVVRNVRTKVADGRLYCPGCGIYDYGWNNQQLRNVWVLAQGETATIDKPVKTDADIWGVEAGFDVQNDIHNTLGIFASYRKGEYDLSGKADKLRSNVGSEIDIDSYLAGLYYRYDKNMNWLFATVYGGVQQADAKTDDKIAKFDTDGIEFGAGIEAGHTFALSNDLTLDPSLGLYYTQINFDDAKDNVGKEYDWKDIKHLEAELGAKLEKQIDYAKIYVKPSIIQTITSGDSVKITGLNKLSTYDDATLGRIELGGRYGFTDALSAYGWVNYTFGADYDATAFGAGLNYAW